MRLTHCIALAASLLFSALIPGDTEAALQTLKPDLRILLIGPSAVSPYHARVVITNSEFASAAASKLWLYIPSAASVTYSLPAIGPNSGIVVHVYLGVPVNKCGQATFGLVDSGNQVAEGNENNNGLWYFAPPC